MWFLLAWLLGEALDSKAKGDSAQVTAQKIQRSINAMLIGFLIVIVVFVVGIIASHN